MERTESSHNDDDPAPLQHVDAERVSGEQAEDLPEGSRGETADADDAAEAD
jgi:hypothetical protein